MVVNRTLIKWIKSHQSISSLSNETVYRKILWINVIVCNWLAIWQASRQSCCQAACQTSKRCDICNIKVFNLKLSGFKTGCGLTHLPLVLLMHASLNRIGIGSYCPVGDELTIRGLIAWWIQAWARLMTYWEGIKQFLAIKSSLENHWALQYRLDLHITNANRYHHCIMYSVTNECDIFWLFEI